MGEGLQYERDTFYSVFPPPLKSTSGSLITSVRGHRHREENSIESLVEQHNHEVQSHFDANVRFQMQTEFSTPVERSRAWDVLEGLSRLFEQAQDFYVKSFRETVLPRLQNKQPHKSADHPGAHPEAKFRRDVHSMFVRSVPSQRFSKTLSFVLYDAGCKIWRLHERRTGDRTPDPNIQARLTHLLKALQKVGLGGVSAQCSFAHAMDQLMSVFIVSQYMKVDWYGRQSVTKKLRDWVKGGFAPLVRMVMDCITEKDETSAAGHAAEIQQWQDMAIGRLGRARAENIFDYIINWDKSIGAILDLKEYITTNTDRAHLVISFIDQLHRRLLRPGTTTTHILDVYIYVIRAFKELDPKGVLLDRVAQPIRRYLKDRTDTAGIIVSSLLADIEDEDGNQVDPGEEISKEIASELLKPILSTNNDYDDDLNWTDMTWTPEPIDASADYKSSKTSDVISYLLTLFDREDFITELKNVLGEHLLKNEDSEFEKEIRLLELFKLRLGDAQLQPCEVMLRDVVESKRLNTAIINSHPTEPAIRSQVLSSFFWPPLRDDTFKTPLPVQQAQAEYEAGFEALKDMRKLHWLPALGKVTVEIALQDRSIETECSTWQASVVYAFQRQDDEPARVGGVARTVEQLEEMLEMDESLVRNALNFWIGERVLGQHPDPARTDTYVVLERLTGAAAQASTAADIEAAQEAAAAEPAGGVVTSMDLLERNRVMYEKFIEGMLTNQGGMTRQRILMMLKMAMPGGFPGGVEELGEVLEGLAKENKVQKGGGDIWSVLNP